MRYEARVMPPAAKATRPDLSLWLRRAIVVVALALFAGMAGLLYLRVKASERARDATFLEDASAIEPAFRRALGPGVPVLELAIEIDRASARVVLDERGNTREFVLDRADGYVVDGAPAAAPERDDVAFALGAVPFAELTPLRQRAEAALGGPAVRVVVDRPPGSGELRLRFFAEDGRATEVLTPPAAAQ
jgi:hypothetical protein